MTPTLGLVLVGAGLGRRMRGQDKIWVSLAGHPVVWHSVARLVPHVARAVLVVRPEMIAHAATSFRDFDLTVVAGGPERRDSVAIGMRALGVTDVIAIHDAARPFATPDLLYRGAALLQAHDAAIPTLPLTDTIKRVDSAGAVVGTVDRRELVAAQTPQLFRAGAILRAHNERPPTSVVTDDAQLVEALGLSVVTYAGDARNVKITTPLDLEIADFIAAQGPALHP